MQLRDVWGGLQSSINRDQSLWVSHQESHPSGLLIPKYDFPEGQNLVQGVVQSLWLFVATPWRVIRVGNIKKDGILKVGRNL